MRVIAHKLRSAGQMFLPYARSVKLIATADAGSRIPSEIDIIMLYLSVCVTAKRSAQPAISGDSHADNGDNRWKLCRENSLGFVMVSGKSADEPYSQRGDCSALALRQPPPASPTHANIPRRLQLRPASQALGRLMRWRATWSRHRRHARRRRD